MDLVKSVLYPILPDDEERTKFLSFLKSAIQTDQTKICVITGDYCSGKSTLVAMARLAVKDCLYLGDDIQKRGRTLYNMPLYSKLVLIPSLWGGTDETCDFTGVCWMINHPNIKATHYLLQGHPSNFPHIPEDPKYIHIHLENDILAIYRQSENKIYDIIKNESDELQRQLLELISLTQEPMMFKPAK